MFQEKKFVENLTDKNQCLTRQSRKIFKGQGGQRTKRDEICTVVESAVSLQWSGNDWWE